MENRWKHINMILGVVAISFSPLVVKAVSFTPAVSAFYRSLYAAIFTLGFAFLSRGSQPLPFKNTKWLLPSIYAGLFLGADLVIWHKTIVYLGAGPATFLGNSQIIFMTVFAALVFKEKIPLMYYFVVAVVMSGLYLLIPLAVNTVSRPEGYALGLLVGLTYAGMLVSLRYAKMFTGEDYPEILSLSVVFWVSALFAGVYAAGIEGSALLSSGIKNHALIAATAFFCQTFGWYMINTNIMKVPAHEGSLLLMLQPVLATVWGALIFIEPLSSTQFIGIIMTLAGIVFYQIKYVNPATLLDKSDADSDMIF